MRSGSLRNEEAIGREHYDGFNFSFRERVKQLQLQANYTLAWAYGYGTAAVRSATIPKVPLAPFASWEWGPSPNDERHHIYSGRRRRSAQGLSRFRLFFSTVRLDRSTSPTPATLSTSAAVPLLELLCPNS